MNLKQKEGCNLSDWIDEHMTEWKRNMINNLVLEKKLVEAQLNAAHNEVKELQSQISLYLYENDTLKLKYKAISVESKMKRGSNIHRGWASIYFCLKIVVVILLILLIVKASVLLF
ncbi:Lebercilin [Bienertia sinuspersici]